MRYNPTPSMKVLKNRGMTRAVSGKSLFISLFVWVSFKKEKTILKRSTLIVLSAKNVYRIEILLIFLTKNCFDFY